MSSGSLGAFISKIKTTAAVVVGTITLGRQLIQLYRMEAESLITSDHSTDYVLMWHHPSKPASPASASAIAVSQTPVTAPVTGAGTGSVTIGGSAPSTWQSLSVAYSRMNSSGRSPGDKFQLPPSTAAGAGTATGNSGKGMGSDIPNRAGGHLTAEQRAFLTPLLGRALRKFKRLDDAHAADDSGEDEPDEETEIAAGADPAAGKAAAKEAKQKAADRLHARLVRDSNGWDLIDIQQYVMDSLRSRGLKVELIDSSLWEEVGDDSKRTDTDSSGPSTADVAASAVKAAAHAGGVEPESKVHKPDGSAVHKKSVTVFSVSAPGELLCREAERLKLQKRTAVSVGGRPAGSLQRFTVAAAERGIFGLQNHNASVQPLTPPESADRDSSVVSTASVAVGDKPKSAPLSTTGTAGTKASTIDGAVDADVDDGSSRPGVKHTDRAFWTSGERQRVVLSILHSLKCSAVSSAAGAIRAPVNTTSALQRAVLPQLNLANAITYFPLHDAGAKQSVFRRAYADPGSDSGLRTLNSYFGSEVAFYFAWLAFYTRWLALPALFGVLVQLIASDGDSSFASSRFLYAVFSSIWSVCFLEFWKRRSSRLAYQWNVMDREDQELVSEPRPAFTGTPRKNPRSGLWELHYSDQSRRFKYLVTWPIILVFMGVVVATLLLSFWLEDYTLQLQKSKYFGDQNWLNDWITLVPTILYALSIPLYNKHFTSLATVLTEWENHQHETSFQNALVLKLVTFYFVNSCV